MVVWLASLESILLDKHHQLTARQRGAEQGRDFAEREMGKEVRSDR